MQMLLKRSHANINELLKTTYLSCKNVIDFVKSINLYDKL